MIRKDFIKFATLSGAYLASNVPAKAEIQAVNVNSGLSAAQLQQFLISQIKLKPETVDRIIIGNPETVIRKIGTCWMSNWETCRIAVESGQDGYVIRWSMQIWNQMCSLQ